jgi:maltose alpha-D-glucosyltransferase/alpha-amylase
MVPLAFVSGDQARQALAETPGAVLARITGARKGAIIDGVLDDDTCNRLLDLTSQGAETATRAGRIRGFSYVPLDLPADRKWVRGGDDQSNSLAFVNEKYALKLFRRVEPGVNPEIEMGEFLTRHGFTRIPALFDALQYERPSKDSATLAVLQEAIKHQGSGWEFTVDELRRYYERVIARVHRPTAPEGSEVDSDTPPPFFAALENWYLATAATLGRRTAELHLVLGNGIEPMFAPEPLAGDSLRTTAERMAAHTEGVLDLLQSRLDRIPDAGKPQAEAVLQARSTLLATFDALRRLKGAGMRTRVHGDYHLGQVLRTDDDFVILDFEGEPGRTLDERRAKHSPLKDVAGMLRSFSYAAYAALFAFTVYAPDDDAVLETWGETWQHWASQAFLASYRATLGSSTLVPAGADFDVLLHAMMLDKALYELGYELNNRPEWVRIPLAGILKLALPLQS